MLHLAADYAPIQDPRGIIPVDEPVFLLRATDANSVGTLEDYANRLRQNGKDREHVAEIERHIERFKTWQEGGHKKAPDVPIGMCYVDHDQHVADAQAWSELGKISAADADESTEGGSTPDYGFGNGSDVIVGPDGVGRERREIELSDPAPTPSDDLTTIVRRGSDLPEPNVAGAGAVSSGGLWTPEKQEPIPPVESPADADPCVGAGAPAPDANEESSCPAEERHARGEDRDTEDGSSNESTRESGDDDESPAQD